MAAVEMELSGIRRSVDYRYMIENREGFWHVSVCEADGGGLDGFMASCGHLRLQPDRSRRGPHRRIRPPR